MTFEEMVEEGAWALAERVGDWEPDDGAYDLARIVLKAVVPLVAEDIATSIEARVRTPPGVTPSVVTMTHKDAAHIARLAANDVS